MNNNEDEDENVVDLTVDALGENQVIHATEQRKRKVEYVLFKNDVAGLAELVKVVGAAAIVDRYQSFYVARNSLLSLMDKEDDPKFEGTRTLPEGGSEETVKFDLTRNFPKPGGKRTKWGDLKPYVEQAKSILTEGFAKSKEDKHDPAKDENVRRVASKLKEISEKQKDSLLG